MNSEQITGIAKPLIGAVVGYLAASHLFFDAQTWNIILTSLVTIGLAIWSYRQNTTRNQIGRVDAMAKDPGSPVKGIIVESTVAGHKLTEEMPGNTTMLEGTAAARSASEAGSPAVQAGI